MSQTATVSVRRCFADVPDPRREHLRLHSLWDLIAITICAVVAGADTWVDVAKYGERKFEWLQTFLELPNGIPSHDTFDRVFRLLDPEALQQGFHLWMTALVEATAGRLVAVDGKALRHSFDTAAGKGPLHLVSAWASENNLMLGQRAVDCKSNEITAIPELLKILELKGALVTIDAMGCQKAIAAQIDAAGADYVLALKGNQETIHADVQQAFIDGLENNFAGVEHHCYRTYEEEHGRKERREYHVMSLPEGFADRHPQWVGLRSLGMVIRERQVGDAEPSDEVHHYLNSLAPKVKLFARAVRGHWGIENSLHWVLDIAFREDESRLRKDHGPENLALMRRLAVSLLKNDETEETGIACKRKQAGWDNDYLLQVLGANLK
jgi:predicted transposase YbfD/YdcC